MGALSLRIPDELAAKLDHEAELEQRGRSEILRDALDNYLEARARERLLASMVREARALYADTAAVSEATQVSENFLAAENETLEYSNSGGRRRKSAAIPGKGRWWK